MKKILSLILAAALTLSLTGCRNDPSDSSADSSAPDSADSGLTEDSAEANTTDNDNSQNGSTVILSNPVKKTTNGDIDMEAALSYETNFDTLKAELAAREVDLSLPVSLNARENENTMEVFNYLKSIYGKQVLSAQQQMDLSNTYEDLVFYNAAGDIPAMKGFDFIFTTGSYSSRDMIDAAIKWATESGGLVTFTWHWNVPRDVDNPDLGWAFYMERDGVTIDNFDPLKATTPGTKEYEVAVHDIDLIASYLQEMESHGITVLFRPFHEASDGWFWWGLQNEDKKMIKEGTYPETYQRLWYMMFDRLENYHKLSNIIWVWNGQSKFCVVDPNTYDIAGVDYYASKEDHSPLVSQYEKLADYTYEGKMLALSECGYIPDPQQCADENAMWLYYMVWNGDFIYKDISFDGTPSPNEERLNNDLIKEYFANEHLVTWNDLPEFRFGKKETPNPIVVWEYFKD